MGNKVDLEDDRTVTKQEAENLVNDLEFDFNSLSQVSIELKLLRL